MRIVLDTNVLVSGLLTPLGPCGEIVRALASKEITICIDVRILLEYREVLSRPGFGIDVGEIVRILRQIETFAEFCRAVPLPESLPHPGDNALLEVAISAELECLVTGNLKHFPAKRRRGVRVLSPREFLDYIREHPPVLGPEV